MTAAAAAVAAAPVVGVDAGRIFSWQPAAAAFTPLAGHRLRHGPPPWRTPAAGDPGELIALLGSVDLRGRGGAGFPVARKLQAVAERRSAPVVVVNGVEGEPLAAKDRALLTATPHLVLDGAMVVAAALGARSVVVVATERAVPSLERALAERSGGARDPVPVVVLGAPRAFVAGEETAVVHFITDGDARPTAKPPRPFERGVDRRPTLVQNAETLAQLALLTAHGADWFRSVGTADEPGTTLVTLSGSVGRPGVYEVALGSPLAEVVARAGGATAPLRAVLAGGYFGAYLPADVIGRVHWSRAGLARVGAAPGAGVIHLLAASLCPAADAARTASLLAGESSGQCGPCVNGLAAIASALRDLAAGGRPNPAARGRLELWMAQVEGRGACRFPDGAVGTIRSALTVFADEWAAHARGGCLAGSGRP
ncbi:MAG TPA: NADH-ubiquinone oxidoreductase-F iron-sulfur binding region domain-containing protein [Candidatus Micrarchaeia archaeon]|nr:NADH-ubiquinone oxidoreductase-F iron-sulfur binding region domain-containing protein [Candidatus Micrarchaeia archaeon]